MQDSVENHEVEEVVETEVDKDLEEFREVTQSEDIELDVREAYQELKEKADKEEKEGKGEKPEPVEGEQVLEATEEAPLVDAKDLKGAKTEEIRPPADWDIKEKEWFEKQHPMAKKAIARRAKDLHDRINEVNEHWAKIRKEHQEVTEAITPYQSRFDMAKVSKGEGIKHLLAVDDFIRKDPIAGLEYLANTFGATLEQVVEAKQRRGNVQPLQNVVQQVAPQNDPIHEIQNTLNYLLEERARERIAPVQAGFREAGERLKYETDETGQYLRPELHDDNFVLSLKPIIDGLRQNDPEISPEDLIVRAYQARTGKVSYARKPLPQRNGIVARRATLSTRGSALASPRPAPKDVPDSTEEMNIQIARDLGFDI